MIEARGIASPHTLPSRQQADNSAMDTVGTWGCTEDPEDKVGFWGVDDSPLRTTPGDAETPWS